MKECIACAEQIQEKAQLCRYCNTRQDSKEFLPKSQDNQSFSDNEVSSKTGAQRDDTEEPLEPMASLFNEPKGRNVSVQATAKIWPWSVTSAAAFLTWVLFMTSQGGWRWNALRLDCISPVDDWAEWACNDRGIGETWAITVFLLLLSVSLLGVGLLRRSLTNR